MGVRRIPESEETRRSMPATTAEGREAQLSALAYDLAEKQLREGTASSQVQAHFLKLASTREALEQERIRGEIEINKAKREMLASEKRVEELYGKAINAMRRYAGQDPDPDLEPDEY